MRKSIVVPLTAVVLATAGVAGTTLASASAEKDRSKHAHVFTVVERAVTDTTADTGPAGDSLGDVLAFANPLYNSTDTKQVGTDNGSCVRTAVAAAYECTWTNTLKGGSIVVSGPFYDAADSVMAVTGGTGRYQGAVGQMRLHARNAAGSAYDFTFELQRD